MKFNLSFFLSLFLFLVPTALFAGEFQAIVGIPGVTENITGTSGLNDYINALYRLSISIAALLAVIKIVAAGAKYMLSDIITNKEEAKKDIQGALIGLLIVIAAVIILNTINSDLTRVNFNLEPLVAPTSTAPVVAVDPVDALCSDPAIGGCTRYSCAAVMTDLVSYAQVGCITLGSVSALNGAVVGTALPLPPLISNIAGFIGGGIGGCATGAIAGGVAGLVLDGPTCTAGCSLAGGLYDTSSQICSVPNNAELFTKAQLENNLREFMENQALSGETFTLTECSVSSVGGYLCDQAVTQCRQTGGSTRGNVENQGYSICYRTQTPTTGGTCDGYLEPQTQVCYGNTIDLPPEFTNQTNDIRQMECSSRGGVYDFTRELCVRSCPYPLISGQCRSS